jgi:hypothetical protein
VHSARKLKEANESEKEKKKKEEKRWREWERAALFCCFGNSVIEQLEDNSVDLLG